MIIDQDVFAAGERLAGISAAAENATESFSRDCVSSGRSEQRMKEGFLLTRLLEKYFARKSPVRTRPTDRKFFVYGMVSAQARFS